MLKALTPLLEKPAPYATSGVPFWDDDHISLQMLHAHLDPEFEGASRKHTFIDQSVSWIRHMLPAEQYPALLDLGCGPGLYGERFCRAGYRVTGVDLSRRSIAYAQDSAARQGLDIAYLRQNYLSLALDQQFDLAVMIYCDYGVLSPGDRALLLQAVYRHLRPGGKFLLDVFSQAGWEGLQETQTWESCPEGGFWSPEPYLALNSLHKYPGQAALSQTIVVTSAAAVRYCLWDTYFSPAALEEEARQAGLHLDGLFADVAGAPYRPDSPTLAAVLEKR